MHITVIGVGHVGLVSAAAFARWGHQVVGYDDDATKIVQMQGGEAWFFEPGLDELMAEATTQGRLTFTSDPDAALRDAEVVFVCVGTPPLPGGGPNLSYVEAVGRSVVEHAARDLLLVEKSTVPANTGRRLEQVIQRESERLGTGHRIEVASNPEFLKEGAAVEDTLHPDRVVYGTSSEWSRDLLRQVYATLVREDQMPVVETDVPTAELIKHASNAFLATRISFINAVSQICDRVGADVKVVAEGMGHDVRIGSRFLQAGLGYGGSCFPKDVDAFAHLARQVGYDFALLDEVHAINVAQRSSVIAKLEGELWHLSGKTVAVLGAAFKPGTDDLRESPAVHLANELMEAGAEVRVHDPIALPNLAQEQPHLPQVDTIEKALEGAHAAVIATDWPEYTAITPATYRDRLAYPIIVDARNIYDPRAMLDAGLHYHAMGRPSVGR
ncbi:MAG: UDP-glucose/GDP-mannose dehydrogenase family protein [Nitriliruptoraceae bacterium]